MTGLSPCIVRVSKQDIILDHLGIKNSYSGLFVSNIRALVHSVISLFNYHFEKNKTFDKKQDNIQMQNYEDKKVVD